MSRILDNNLVHAAKEKVSKYQIVYNWSSPISETMEMPVVKQRVIFLHVTKRATPPMDHKQT